MNKIKQSSDRTPGPGPLGIKQYDGMYNLVLYLTRFGEFTFVVTEGSVDRMIFSARLVECHPRCCPHHRRNRLSYIGRSPRLGHMMLCEEVEGCLVVPTAALLTSLDEL